MLTMETPEDMPVEAEAADTVRAESGSDEASDGITSSAIQTNRIFVVSFARKSAWILC